MVMFLSPWSSSFPYLLSSISTCFIHQMCPNHLSLISPTLSSNLSTLAVSLKYLLQYCSFCSLLVNFLSSVTNLCLFFVASSDINNRSCYHQVNFSFQSVLLLQIAWNLFPLILPGLPCLLHFYSTLHVGLDY